MFLSKESRNQGRANAKIPKFLNSLDIKRKEQKKRKKYDTTSREIKFSTGVLLQQETERGGADERRG